jgi:hypothetical protein
MHRRHGETVVSVLQQRAAEALEQGRTIYWKDDTHWNPEGIRIAADAIAKAWPGTRRE